MVTYQKLTYDGNQKLQVESAIRDEEGYRIKDYYAKKTEIAKPGVILTDIAIAAADWVSNNDFPGFPYRADVEQEDITEDMYAAVTYSNTDAATGNYAPSCQTHDGGVYLYSKVNSAITVPSIKVDATFAYIEQSYSAGTDLRPVKIVQGEFIQVLNDLVSTVGNQTITDIKTFTSPIVGDLSGTATNATYLGSSTSNVGSDTKPIKIVNGQAVAVTNALALSTVADTCITGLSTSGTALTFTRKDGTSGTVYTQDTNTTYNASGGVVLSGTTFSAKDDYAVAHNNSLEYVDPTGASYSSTHTNSYCKGYIKFSSGILIQWSGAGSAPGDRGELFDVYFPIRFSSVYYTPVFCNFRVNDNDSSKNGYNPQIFYKEPTYVRVYTGMGNWDRQGVYVIAIGQA